MCGEPRTRPFSPTGSAAMATPCSSSVPDDTDRTAGPSPPDVAERRSCAHQEQGWPTRHRRGPKRLKYQAPQSGPPSDFPAAALHANHREAHNVALRRCNGAFRRRTHTYAKNADALQRTLDRHLLQHNFIRPHRTTGEAPAVRLGIFTTPNSGSTDRPRDTPAIIGV